MSDPITDSSDQGGSDDTSGTTPPAGDGFQPITTQDDLNRVINERLSRERAKYADYRDVKARAAQADQVEADAAAKATEAEAALAGVPAQVAATLRTHLVALHGISDEDAGLFLTATDPETLLKQAQRLAARGGDPTHGPFVSTEGKNPKPVESAERKVVGELFGGAQQIT